MEELDLQYRINVRAAYVLTQSVLLLLKASKGQIVLSNQTQGLDAGKSVSQFAATQHALKPLADSLRKEINADGVRVSSVFPSRTAMLRMERIFAYEGKPFPPELLLQPEDVLGLVMSPLLTPRTAEVTELSIRPMQQTY